MKNKREDVMPMLLSDLTDDEGYGPCLATWIQTLADMLYEKGWRKP